MLPMHLTSLPARTDRSIISITGTAGANGDKVRWYSASTGGSPITETSSGSPYQAWISATTTYYITSFNSTTLCETATRVAVTANVYAIPDVPVVAPSQSFIESPATVTLNATPGANGTTCKWYSSAGGLLTTGLSYAPSVSATTSYYVSSYNSSSFCEGTVRAVASVTLQLNPIISATATIFDPTTPTITLSTTNTYDTYAWTRDNVQVATTPTLVTSLAGMYTVTVTKSGTPGSGTAQPVVLVNRSYVLVNTIQRRIL